ncbi:PPE domain-containing protein, partial [Mycobacterium tuberculosis]|uniref:PPE domain-containing protein n=1 Tax=Mycobacterium tuberculosis TaxID=1773 RepID=UPI00045B5323
MDYAFLPPEINSARMYSGPGPNSMLVAAASWDALAAELASAAENYGSVIARLTGMHWWGPASTSMLAMSAPYVEWLERTAAQTKLAAELASAAEN